MRCVALLLTLVLVERALAAQATGTIAGRTLVAQSGDAARDVRVQLLGSSTETFSDQLGRFRLTGLPRGMHVLRFSRIGVRPLEVEVDLEAGETIELALTLEPVPVALPGVPVTAAPVEDATLERTGFYARRAAGFGAFLARDDLKRWTPKVMTDVLRRVPGVSVRPNPRYGRTSPAGPVDLRKYIISMRGGCTNPLIFLDGGSLGTGDVNLDDLIAIPDLAGIEVYRGAAEVPQRYNATGSACGVIVIWTR